MKKIKNPLIKRYCDEHLHGVKHVTLNPKGPGAVRIHLVPSRNPEESDSIVILNGSDMIPLNTSWSILLSNFIEEMNKFDGKKIGEDELEEVLVKTLKDTKKVYFLTKTKKFKEDLKNLLDTLIAIAYGEDPKVDVGMLSISEFAEKLTAPIRMDIMISSMSRSGKWNCNQKCVHCYAAGQHEAEVKECSKEEFFKIIDKCQKANIAELTFTGGEPTLNPHLVELVEYAKWFVTRLNTNGINLTQTLCERLSKASLDAVQITFYDVDPENHNLLVGGDHWEQTVSGIYNALRAGLAVSINTPLCTINRDYVKTLEFLHTLGITYVTCSGMITTGNARKENSVNTQLTSEELLEILRDASKYCEENAKVLNEFVL